MKNVRATAERYWDVLGFNLNPVNGVCYLKPWISLFPQERPAVERDVYLAVTNVTETFEEMKSKGANIFQSLVLTPHGILEFVVEDLVVCHD